VNEVQSFLLESQGIRGALVRLNETWQQVTAQHTYPSEVRRLLGESVAATVLLANGLKDKPRVSIQLQGDGPLSLLLIQCAGDLKVRGMAHWRPYERGDSLLGEGRLSVNLDTGSRHGLFQGIVPIVSSKLTDCLEAYFAQSEQLATRIVLAAAETRVGGLILQALPGREGDLEEFEHAAALARTVAPGELIDETAEALLPRLFDPFTIRLFKPRPVLHDCRCTPEHLAGIARMLGKDELESLLAERGSVELTCEFCNRAFRYDEDDVSAILRGETPGAVVH
jgi:molecular chaperone Hsp33